MPNSKSQSPSTAKPTQTERKQRQKRELLEIVETLAYLMPGANAELHSAYRQLLAQIEKYEGAKRLLDEFRKRHYQMAVIEGLKRGAAIVELTQLNAKSFPEYEVLIANREVKQTQIMAHYLDDAGVTLPRAVWKTEVRAQHHKPKAYEPTWVEAYSVLTVRKQMATYIVRRRQLAEQVQIARLVYSSIGSRAQIENLLNQRDS